MKDFEKVQECFELLKKNYPNAIGKLGYLETPVGWNKLVTNCAKEIEKAILRLPESRRSEFGALQIKEKFGGLRWYLEFSNPIIEPIREKYEILSRKKCQICGRNGKTINKNDEIVTVCIKHEI